MTSIANNLSMIILLSLGVIDINDLKSLIDKDIILEKMLYGNPVTSLSIYDW